MSRAARAAIAIVCVRIIGRSGSMCPCKHNAFAAIGRAGITERGDDAIETGTPGRSRLFSRRKKAAREEIARLKR
jgi:hypothetical protein